MSGHFYIGLMSGTSTDGIDAVLADFAHPGRPSIIAAAALEMPHKLRETLLALNQPGENELHRAALASVELAQLYGQACQQVQQQANLKHTDIQAIGAHGQTVRHRPELGYTIQLNAPALLAEITSIDVIADFRSRDIAAKGQGAPLVPAFHHMRFGGAQSRVILNLGGIANVTLLHPDHPVQGFDTGPANLLLDCWCSVHTGNPFDNQGQWAATGTASPDFLHYLIHSEPWFKQPPPKSTGRDQFNAQWLNQRLKHWQTGHGNTTLSAADIQATLVMLTARTAANAIERYATDVAEVLVCGGGALNTTLMRCLQRALNCPVKSTQEEGVNVHHVEALAFAWLAWAHNNGHKAGLPEVTGARHPTVPGCRYPA